MILSKIPDMYVKSLCNANTYLYCEDLEDCNFIIFLQIVKQQQKPNMVCKKYEW